MEVFYSFSYRRDDCKQDSCNLMPWRGSVVHFFDWQLILLTNSVTPLISELSSFFNHHQSSLTKTTHSFRCFLAMMGHLLLRRSEDNVENLLQSDSGSEVFQCWFRVNFQSIVYSLFAFHPIDCIINAATQSFEGAEIIFFLA